MVTTQNELGHYLMKIMTNHVKVTTRDCSMNSSNYSIE